MFLGTLGNDIFAAQVAVQRFEFFVPHHHTHACILWPFIYLLIYNQVCLALFSLLRFVRHIYYMHQREKETVQEVVLSRSSFQLHDLQDQLPLSQAPLPMLQPCARHLLMNIFLYKILYHR
jgi:hypothetical protein